MTGEDSDREGSVGDAYDFHVCTASSTWCSYLGGTPLAVFVENSTVEVLFHDAISDSVSEDRR